MSILRLAYINKTNFIELTGNVLAFLHYFHSNNKWLGIIMAIFVFFKLLISLNIFKPFRNLISLILQCMQDITTFLLLVFLMLFTFAVLNYVILVQDINFEVD